MEVGEGSVSEETKASVVESVDTAVESTGTSSVGEGGSVVETVSCEAVPLDR